MSEGNRAAARLRERLMGNTEDKLGRALADLLENPLITGTIGRVFDARERAVQAQEMALGALNIPTTADIERLTRRLRSVSQRLEGIEDGVHRLNRALAGNAIDARLEALEDHLKTLTVKLSGTAPKDGTAPKSSARSARTAGSGARRSASAKPSRARADKD